MFKKIFVCRSVLDFDFEKLCSVSLSHLNVYACLVCGKYFQVSYCTYAVVLYNIVGYLVVLFNVSLYFCLFFD